MAPLVRLTRVDNNVIAGIIIVLSIYIIRADTQEHPLRQVRLEIPKDAVMVECRFNVHNLVIVNMAERGQSHNVFAGVKDQSCEKLLTFSNCQFTNDAVTIWAVFMNVTVATGRTVFCNRTSISGATIIDKSFNITLGDYISPASAIMDTTAAITEKATRGALPATTCPLNETSVSSVNILLVAAIVVLAVLTSYEHFTRK